MTRLPDTDTGNKDQTGCRKQGACFALTGSGNGMKANIFTVALHKAPDKIRAC
ncbi:hypothetical protein OkiPb00197_09520 [Escherichia coli]